WVSLSDASHVGDQIADADNDTKIQVDEDGLDDDIIRFDMVGTEFFRMDNGRLEVANTGNSVFIGAGAGANDHLTNNQNTAVGDSALFSNTTGYGNSANGYRALYSNTTGFGNTANGYQALFSNTSGYRNSAIGYHALTSNTTGDLNTANGYRALYSNTTGGNNTANGYKALYYNTIGIFNTANGYCALYNNTRGGYNTANGTFALYSDTTGYYNTANGYRALYSNTKGGYNTANGYNALYNNTTGSNNTALGYNADVSVDSLTNATAIGANATVSQDSSLILGNAADVGIGTTAPHSSAKLEVTSTDKGFLPPRMTETQRDAISSPIAGLQIFNSTTNEPNYFNGSIWVHFNGTAAETLAIGDYYQGGVIFYLDGSGGGLICAVSNQDGGSGIKWWNEFDVVTGATATAIGTGQANTDLIITIQGPGSYAATVCDDYTVGAYSDWVLPSKNELNTIYQYKAAISETAIEHGGSALVSAKY
ncbi:MAG: hypothetical protein GY727_00550, partial [Gammaproteobacteria bacterium]|nr:hypothetical protein [Gammaproteobacteria bacterium]